MYPTNDGAAGAPFGVAGAVSGYLFPDPGSRDAIGFGDAAFSVRLVDRKLACATIVANHYSRRIYSGSTLHLGVYLGEAFVGVLQYGFAMNPASAGSVVTGTLMSEYLELNRMWLSANSATCVSCRTGLPAVADIR